MQAHELIVQARKGEILALAQLHLLNNPWILAIGSKLHSAVIRKICFRRGVLPTST